MTMSNCTDTFSACPLVTGTLPIGDRLSYSDVINDGSRPTYGIVSLRLFLAVETAIN